MATHYAVRWRPQIYRSTLETVLSGSPANPAADPPTPDTQARTETLQLVAYDDTELGTAGNPYRPGDAATEVKIAIVDEKTLTLALSAFAGKTEAQSKALWDAARDAQIAAWQADPGILAKVRAARGAYLSTFVLLA